MVDDCVNKRGKSIINRNSPTISSNNGGTTRPKARTVSLDVECRRVGNKITPVVSAKVMEAYGRDAVMAACK
jgi:hypothetical protein